MGRANPSFFDDLIELPWWVSVVVGVLLFGALRWGLPWLAADETDSMVTGTMATLASMAPTFAPFAAVFLLPATLSAIRQWKDRKLLDSQGNGNLGAIHLLDSRQFESLVGEYYRRKGFRVRTNPGDGPDGGVDVWLRGDKGLYLVQCKRWKQKVGVGVVRELYGVMAAEGAYGGAVVTMGAFSADARAFATGKPIDLVDGRGLQGMIAEVQRNREEPPEA